MGGINCHLTEDMFSAPTDPHELTSPFQNKTSIFGLNNQKIFHEIKGQILVTTLDNLLDSFDNSFKLLKLDNPQGKWTTIDDVMKVYVEFLENLIYHVEVDVMFIADDFYSKPTTNTNPNPTYNNHVTYSRIRGDVMIPDGIWGFDDPTEVNIQGLYIPRSSFSYHTHQWVTSRTSRAKSNITRLETLKKLGTPEDNNIVYGMDAEIERIIRLRKITTRVGFCDSTIIGHAENKILSFLEQYVQQLRKQFVFYNYPISTIPNPDNSYLHLAPHVIILGSTDVCFRVAFGSLLRDIFIMHNTFFQDKVMNFEFINPNVLRQQKIQPFLIATIRRIKHNQSLLTSHQLNNVRILLEMSSNVPIPTPKIYHSTDKASTDSRTSSSFLKSAMGYDDGSITDNSFDPTLRELLALDEEYFGRSLVSSSPAYLPVLTPSHIINTNTQIATSPYLSNHFIDHPTSPSIINNFVNELRPSKVLSLIQIATLFSSICVGNFNYVYLFIQEGYDLARCEYTEEIQKLFPFSHILGVPIDLIEPDTYDFITPRPGYTLLHYALIYNDEYTIKHLINTGADVNIISEDGYTPLSLYCDRVIRSHFNMIAQHLRVLGQTKNPSNNVLTDLAIKPNTLPDDFVHLPEQNKMSFKVSPSIVNLLIRSHADPHYSIQVPLPPDEFRSVTFGMTPLMLYCQGDLETRRYSYISSSILKLFMINHVDVNAVTSGFLNCTALMMLCANLSPITAGIILRFYKYGVQLNQTDSDGNTPLHLYSARPVHPNLPFSWDANVLIALLQCGSLVTYNKKGINPVMSFVETYMTLCDSSTLYAIITAFVYRGAIFKDIFIDDLTILSFYLKYYDEPSASIVETLIKTGVDIHHTDDYGQNALMALCAKKVNYSMTSNTIKCQQEVLNIIISLVNAGIDITTCDKDSNNALMLYIQSHSIIVPEVLLLLIQGHPRTHPSPRIEYLFNDGDFMKKKFFHLFLYNEFTHHRAYKTELKRKNPHRIIVPILHCQFTPILPEYIIPAPFENLTTSIVQFQSNFKSNEKPTLVNRRSRIDINSRNRDQLSVLEIYLKRTHFSIENIVTYILTTVFNSDPPYPHSDPQSRYSIVSGHNNNMNHDECSGSKNENEYCMSLDEWYLGWNGEGDEDEDEHDIYHNVYDCYERETTCEDEEEMYHDYGSNYDSDSDFDSDEEYFNHTFKERFTTYKITE